MADAIKPQPAVKFSGNGNSDVSPVKNCIRCYGCGTLINTSERGLGMCWRCDRGNLRPVEYDFSRI